jgi:hypothetical protein
MSARQNNRHQTANRYKTLKRFYNKEYKKWLRVATVELNGYFKVSDFHSVLQTFFPATSHILNRYK